MVVKKNLEEKILWVSLVTILLTFIVYAGFYYYEHQKRAQFMVRRSQVLENLVKLQTTYKEHGNLIRQWSKFSPANERDEVRILLSENDGLHLQVPVEMKRFDFVQERLNVLLSQWNENTNIKKHKPKGLDKLEYSLNRERKSYAESAYNLNTTKCRTCQNLTVPLFQAEAQYLSIR